MPKTMSKLDGNQVLDYSFNTSNNTVSVDSFLAGQVGAKIAMAISTTSIANDTETYTYSYSGTTIMVLKVIYTDGTRETLLSVERIS